jgi:uncharacterized membrane protein
MAAHGLDTQLARWIDAGLIDTGTASAIRAYEDVDRVEAAPAVPALRWPVAIVLGLGGLLLGAGLLLFVAAHWDWLSPAGRFAVVFAMLVGLHLAAVLAGVPALQATLHTVGTVALGAGIYLVGQIFNLSEHWPSGLFLWALGALAGTLLLRSWPQALLLALLAPLWLMGEYMTRWPDRSSSFPVAGTGLFLFSVAYLGADADGRRTPIRRALGILGALAILPLAFVPVLGGRELAWSAARAVDWIVAFGVPITVGFALGGRSVALAVAAMALWAIVEPRGFLGGDVWSHPLLYVWSAAGALVVVLWGFFLRVARAINVGIAGFAITVGVFYFSNVMDKLGRSASLVGLGLLFLGGGYVLEQARRRLVAGATVAA